MPHTRFLTHPPSSKFALGALAIQDESSSCFLELLSFQSVSFNPTMALLSLERTDETRVRLEEVGSFAASFSSIPNSPEFSQHQAKQTSPPDSPSADFSPTFGHPLLASNAAWIECVIESLIETDARLILLASVISMGVRSQTKDANVFTADEYPPLSMFHGAS